MKKGFRITWLILLPVALAVLVWIVLIRDTKKTAIPAGSTGENGNSAARPVVQLNEALTQPPTKSAEAADRSQSRNAPGNAGSDEVSARDRFYRLADLLPAIEEETDSAGSGRVVERRMLHYPDKNGSLVITEKTTRNGVVEHRSSYIGDHFIVRFSHKMKEEEVRRILESENIRFRRQLGQELVYTVSFADPAFETFRRVKKKLEEATFVESIGVDYMVFSSLTPSDPDFSTKLWGQSQSSDIDIDAPEAWNFNYDCRNTEIAVLDSGVDSDHPDLVENLDLKQWADVVGNTGEDNDSHGTHVIGTIGAVGNNGIGVNGICWLAKIISIKVLNDKGEGTNSGLIVGIRYVTDSTNARVINASLTSEGNTPEVEDAIGKFVDKNNIFVAAAGNDNVDLGISPRYPASYNISRLVTVGSLMPDNSLAGSSNYGSAVNICAPGVGIYSTWTNGGYGEKGGTSMAAPFVSGSVALVWSVDPTLSADFLISTMYSGSDTHGNNKVTEAGRRLNLYNFMRNAVDFSTLLKKDYKTILGKDIESQELEAWLTEITDGTLQYMDSRLEFIYRKQEFTELSESKIVRILGKKSDSVLQDWKKQLYQGKSWDMLEETLIHSATFRDAADTAYKNALGKVNPVFVDWQNSIKSGASFSSLLDSLLESSDFQSHLNTVWMNAVGVDKHPEIKGWADKIKTGESVENLKLALLDSETFRAAVSGTYQRIAGDPAQDSEIVAWREKIKSGSSFTKLSQEFIHSDFATNKIGGIISGYLEVAPAQEDINEVKRTLESGGSVSDFSKKLLNSLRVKIELNKIFVQKNNTDMSEEDLKKMQEDLMKAGSLNALRQSAGSK